VSAPQDSSLGAVIKHCSFTLTGTAAPVKTWLADSSARDLDTGAVPAFSLDNIANVLLTNYTGTILYGGSNSQPITWPANTDFALPSSQFHSSTYIKASSGSFTVYAIVVFKS
jgi:hypothetical protein